MFISKKIIFLLTFCNYLLTPAVIDNKTEQ
jgi:hypothetical protein